MTTNEQQGKLRYEKTNPIQWLYDKLFPLPAVCPVCMEQQERLGRIARRFYQRLK